MSKLHKLYKTLYERMLWSRLIEEHMLLLLRKGRISKWFSGIGQEAIAVGAASALDDDEYIFAMHRNLGVFTSRQIPLSKLVSQWIGKSEGFTKGRDRTFHFGTNDYKIIGMISHLATQLSVADGVALGNLLRQEKKVVLAFTGEGATSEGEFHEALNVAAVWDLPIIFLVENNGYALSTPTDEQYRCRRISDRAKGYGIKGQTIDGNDVIGVYSTINSLAKKIRKKPAPVLLECLTFRMRGHEEASGTKYVPQNLFDEWGKKDPILRLEKRLKKEGIESESYFEETRNSFKEKIESEVEEGMQASDPSASLDQEYKDVYRHFIYENIQPSSSSVSEKRLVDAVSDGLKQSMEIYDNLIIMGQDIAEYGGVFKVTEGFLEQFGKERIRNTPICESVIVGAAFGLSIAGMKSVVEMQFSDFATCAVTQIVNNLAKSNYRWGQNADTVIRMPTGAGVRAGPFHSQSLEVLFSHVPGLKVVYPSNPYDAKGLLCEAIKDPNPVIFFEHKLLYRSTKQDIPDDYYTGEIGKAGLVRDGEDVSIITYGLGVRWAEELQERYPDVSMHILDLRTLLPYDKPAIIEAVQKTHRVMVLTESTLSYGVSAEIAAFISEACFEFLDAPVTRVASLDTPIPFAAPLEDQFLPIDRIDEALENLLSY